MIQSLFETQRQQSSETSMRFVDLGLPSGTLWAESDVEEPTIPGCSLPTYEQAQEMIECCDFSIAMNSEGTRFFCATGPSGQYILFPM